MKTLNKLITFHFFSSILKIFVLLFLILLIVIGIQAHSTNDAFLKELRNLNFANLIVWSYWWPFLVVSSIFFGRIWCMICPVELITSLASKVGLKKERPNWLKSGWVITLLYIVVLFVGINGFAIHRSPRYMAIYLLILVFLAIVVGIIYKKNTFCKSVCPIGILLGLYSRFSFLGWRVKNPKTCDTCHDKSCISKNNLYKINAKSCGVDLYPRTITNNSDCILCGGCRKACKNNNNEDLAERPNPGFVRLNVKEGMFSKLELTSSQVAFSLILSGFVVYEILSEWSATKFIIMFAPEAINQQFEITNPLASGFFKSFTLFVIFPLVIWLIPYLAGKLFKVKISLAHYLKYFSAAFIPIMAAAHLCKALLKSTSRIPYFEYVFNDLNGLSNTQLLLNGDITLFKLGANPQMLISILLLIVMLFGIYLSTITVRQINKTIAINRGLIMYLIPIAYGTIFLLTIVAWRFF